MEPQQYRVKQKKNDKRMTKLLWLDALMKDLISTFYTFMAF